MKAKAQSAEVLGSFLLIFYFNGSRNYAFYHAVASCCLMAEDQPTSVKKKIFLSKITHWLQALEASTVKYD